MDAERREVLRRVMKAMRHPAARIPLADYNADGGRQAVICLADDTLEYAVSRVLAVGGRATVVIPRDGGLVPLSWDVDASSATLVEVDSPLQAVESVAGVAAPA